jgi:hypothetical protein
MVYRIGSTPAFLLVSKRATMALCSVVFIANTGRDDPPLPDYLKEALARFKKEGGARYLLVAHDVAVAGSTVASIELGMHGDGKSTQYAILDMLGKFNPGAY